MSTNDELTESASWLLGMLYQAWVNVPPGLEVPFQIEDRDESYIISHQGLSGKAVAPDWIAFRRLVRGGFIEQLDTTSFLLTAKGEQVALHLPSQLAQFEASSKVELVWNNSTSDSRAQTVNIFCAYAHEDEGLLADFKKHMSVIERSGLVGLWTDRDIQAGSEWEPDIDQHLLNDELILLFISADFFSSDYCSSKELVAALERHDRGDARVIPVIVRPCDWKSSPIAHLQAIPKDGQPVTAWADQDEAWADAVRKIRGILGELPIKHSGRVKSAGEMRESTQLEVATDEDLKELRNALVSSEIATDEGLGLLELEERIEESSNSIAEQLTLSTSRTMALQTQMEEWAASLPPDAANLRLAQKLKIAHGLANIFDPYSDEIQERASIIEEHFDVFGNSFFAAHNLIDYGDPDQRLQAREIMESARTFGSDVYPAVAQIESARSVFKAIPPLTKDLRKSTQRCNSALSSFANAVRKGTEYADKIASTIEERLRETEFENGHGTGDATAAQ